MSLSPEKVVNPCVICGRECEEDTHSTCGSKDCDAKVSPYGFIHLDDDEQRELARKRYADISIHIEQ